MWKISLLAIKKEKGKLHHLRGVLAFRLLPVRYNC